MPNLRYNIIRQKRRQQIYDKIYAKKSIKLRVKIEYQ